MTERWVKMVEKEYKRGCVGRERKAWLDKADVVKLLARQHRAMVRVVKKREAGVDNFAFRDGYNTAKRDILAALAKQGGGKK